MMRLLCFATSGHEKVDWIWMSGIRIGLSEVDFQADESIFHLFERIFNLHACVFVYFCQYLPGAWRCFRLPVWILAGLGMTQRKELIIR